MKKNNCFKAVTKERLLIAIVLFGIIFISTGIGGFIAKGLENIYLIFIFSFLILSGIIITIKALKCEINAIYSVFNNTSNNLIDYKKLSYLINEKRLLVRGPKIVVLGGGTGLSTLLRGLKSYTSNITAIVTVADDGGGSGVLRETLGMLPPGDIRNCLLALADTEPLMEELLQYRFNDGMLKGQSFGNLFIAAMNGICTNFEEAIQKMSDVLAVKGKVLPVTLSNVKLFAELENDYIIEGESKISKREKYNDIPIKKVYIEPSNAKPLIEAIQAIDDADIIILGPGSLYTSIIPNLLVEDIVRHLESSKANKVYVCNIMTQPGETINYTVCDHIDAINRYSKKKLIDYAIINNGKIPNELYNKYAADGASEVVIDREKLEKQNINIIEDNFVYKYKNHLRHNSDKLAVKIIELVLSHKYKNDKKRKIESYYLHYILNKNYNLKQ